MSHFIKARPFATIIAAAGLFAFAAPSLAAAEGKKVEVKVVEKNGKTLYCVKQEAITGSLMGKNVCRTKEEWAAQGVVMSKAGDPKTNALAANPQAANQN